MVCWEILVLLGPKDHRGNEVCRGEKGTLVMRGLKGAWEHQDLKELEGAKEISEHKDPQE